MFVVRLFVCRAFMHMSCVCMFCMYVCMSCIRACVCMSCVRAYVCLSCVRAWCMYVVCSCIYVVRSCVCAFMHMCIRVYVREYVCEYVAHSCVCRAFVGMPCVHAYFVRSCVRGYSDQRRAFFLLRIYQNPIHLNGTRTRFWTQR